MPLIESAADAFGVLTIALVIPSTVLGLICIYRVVYLSILVKRRDFAQLRYFNRPWITRVSLIVIAVWWSIGEIVRLSFLKGKIVSSSTWQRNICKIYIVSNLGISEPCILLMLMFLLRATLQNRETGALSRRWNRKTISYMFLFCLPVLVTQTILVFVGPHFLKEDKGNWRRKTGFSFRGNIICTYPLFSTILLGFFDAILIGYASYAGILVLSLVINKYLRRRLYWLIFSFVLFVPVRVLFLGFSVLPQPDNFSYELIIFLAFVFMLSCILVGVVVLVYLPVADAMVLRDVGQRDTVELPYDDYYYDGSSLVANMSRHDPGRISDASTKPGSISFRTMIKDDRQGLDGLEEAGSSSQNAFHIGSPSGFSSTPARPMLPLIEFPRY